MDIKDNKKIYTPEDFDAGKVLKPTTAESPKPDFFLNAERDAKRHLSGVQDFIKSDRNNQNNVISPILPVLSQWFSNGVTYQLTTLQGKVYTNEPDILSPILEKVTGEVLLNILKYREISALSWLDLLMSGHAIPLKRRKGDVKATFGVNILPIPYKSVSTSETMLPSPRSEYVTSVWYTFTIKYQWSYITTAKETVENNLRATSDRAIERQLDTESRLRDVFTELEIAECEACRRGMEPIEVSTMLKRIGIERKPDTIRINYDRHKVLYDKVRRGIEAEK